MNWNHVDHQITCEVLEHKSIDDGSVCQALVFADQCLQADQHNEYVSYEVYGEREAALDDANVLWVRKDVLGTIECLRRFWSI